ncbi:MAG: HNH endonuclease [Desulfobulbaceae bacterium]|nr:HNH endonuclease [Desulfobulbaceae bacterium]
MDFDDFGFTGIDEAAIRKEKHKARELRKSRWWQNRISSGICHYCGGKFSPAELTMDHLHPLASGGRSTKGNVVPACKECNNKKKNMLPMDWEAYIKK